MIIIGLGTGRCGTLSFSTLLKAQQGFRVFHEYRRLSWNSDLDKLADVMNYFLQLSKDYCVVSDTASYYLNYVPFIWEKYRSVKFVCLRRPCHEVARSFLHKTPTVNHWTKKDSRYWDDEKWSENAWDRCFPQYNAPKEEAIRLYWLEYNKRALEFEFLFKERFRTFDMHSVLNTESGQQELVDFLGIDNWNFIINIHENAGRRNENKPGNNIG